MPGVTRLSSIALVLLACGPASESAPADAGSAASSPPAISAPPPSGSAAGSSSADRPGGVAPTGSIGSADAGGLKSTAPKADASHLVLKGNPKQGGVVFAKVDLKVGRIEFPGHRAVVSDDGEFPVAFFRNAAKTETMKIFFKDGSMLEHTFQVEQRTYDTDKIDGLPPDVVRLDAKDKKANADAEARIDQVRMKYSPTNCYKDGFIWPTAGKVTSRYGQLRVLNGTDGGIHWGVDMAVPVGTAVKAPACGTVTFTETSDPLSGGTLVIDHGQGLSSTFIHLSGFKKKVGDVVKQGDVVASSGKTGRATGPHLHWGMNFFEIRVDPELLAPAAATAK